MSDPTPELPLERQLLLEAASEVVGLTAPDPAYLRLVAPWEAEHDVARAQSIASVSDCYLVVLGIQERVLGVPARGRYVIESAPELLRARALEAHAYADIHASQLVPEPADVLVWAASASAPAHAETCVSVFHSGDIVVLGVVAGGERNSVRRETIDRMTRAVRRRADGRLVDTANGRVLDQVLDAEKLAAHYGLVV